MVVNRDPRRVTDINRYEAACQPSFALEIFYVSRDGVTCYTCDCLSVNATGMYFDNKKGKGQKILCPPGFKKWRTYPLFKLSL